MEHDYVRAETQTDSIEYVSTGVPANFVVVRVPEEGGGGELRPGDLAVIDQEIDGAEGQTVMFRYAERAVFGQCVVRDGEWFVRDSAGELRNATEMIRDGAVYQGTVHHIVRPGKERG